MTAKLSKSDAKRFALAEAHGLDPDHELISLPFPSDPDAARALGVLKRRAPELIPIDFAPSAADLALYVKRGATVDEIAQRTGLGDLARAFCDGYANGV